MLIKVCGMRDPQNIRDIEAAAPDMLGLIFAPRSPRFVSQVPDYLPQAPVVRVGVFVHADLDEVARRVEEYALGAVQLHGGESPAYCREVRQRLPEVQIIKVISVAEAADLRAADAYAEVADLLLFDTRCPQGGGSGQQFDWSLLEAYDGPLPFLLSGGLGPDDAPQLRQFAHPRCVGIDINSRFETEPALKSAPLVAQFIKTLRA